jgi:hypothetical protein
MSTAVTGSDQAEGLRNIFGAELCRVICIASTLDADSTIHLGHGTAQTLKQHNNHVLLVDEIPLAQRKTMTGFLYPTRYDLGQVFNNAVPLSHSIRQIDEHLWYATSTKLRSEVEHRFAKYPQLDERLIKERLAIDYVLFPTIDPQAQIIAFYGSNVQRILVTAGDQASLSKALVMLRQMAIFQVDKPLAVIIVGGVDEAAGTVAFERLQNAAKSALHQEIEFIGWISAVTARRVELDSDDLSWNPPNDGPQEEFVLPLGFFKAISAKISS